MGRQLTWLLRAKCDETVSELFDRSVIPGKAGLKPTVTREGEHAMRLCTACHVRADCLAYAHTEMPHYDGIVAGEVFVDGVVVKNVWRPYCD